MSSKQFRLGELITGQYSFLGLRPWGYGKFIRDKGGYIKRMGD